MRIHNHWKIEPMSAAASVDTAAFLSRGLEDRISRSEGVNIERARRIVAEKTSVPVGTLENLRREPPRLKSIPSWIEGKLAAFMVRNLEAEISRLTHDLEIARRVATRPDADEIREAETAIDVAREAIGRITR